MRRKKLKTVNKLIPQMAPRESAKTATRKNKFAAASLLLFVMAIILSTGALAHLESKIAALQSIESDVIEQTPTEFDKLALLKIDFIEELLMHLVFKKVETFARYDESVQKKVRRVFDLHEIYLKHKDLFGTSKDYLRTHAFRSFVKEALNFINPEAANFQPMNSFSHQWTILKEAAMTLTPLFFSAEERKTDLGFKRALDFLNRISPLFLEKGVEFQGENLSDYIARINGSQEVTLIVMNHAHPQLDNFLMAKIMAQIKKPSAIVALAQGWSFSPVAKIAMANQGVISVGERGGLVYKHTARRILGAIQNGTKVIFLYPEGSTGSGIGEIKPLAPGFSRRLIPLLAQNHAVNILVLTNMDLYAKLGALEIDHPARVIVSPFITSSKLKEHLKQPPEFLDDLIRKIWLFQLPSDSQRIAGQFRTKTLLESLPPQCRNLLGSLKY